MPLDRDPARKFLELIRQLHDQGYQPLRIVPYVRDGPAPIWICDLAPASAIRSDHGGLPSKRIVRPAFYSSRYIPDSPWRGFVKQSLAEAARFFLKIERELAETSRGPDPAYVTWYKEMLAVTAPQGIVASY